MKTITVLIVDDHKVFRQGLKALLESENEVQVLGEAGNGKEAVEICRKLNPDVVIMDIAMPGMSGILATRRIIKRCKETKVVILSAHLSRTYVTETLKSGAKGYVLKENAVEDVVDAIKTVVKGQTYLDPEVASLAVETMLGEESKGNKNPFGTLTPREQEVLQLIVDGKPNKEIAEHLSISVRTVENHRASIMKKSGVRNTSSLVKLAIRTEFYEA